LSIVFLLPVAAVTAAEPSAALTLSWEKNFLRVRGEAIPGREIAIQYLEAYCRPGSTDRDWRETVIGHDAEKVSAKEDGSVMQLRARLRGGVIVEHRTTAGPDEVDFRLPARNPTATASQAHWAQPCVRVDKFTGCSRDDARALVPVHARKCFIFLNGELTRLP